MKFNRSMQSATRDAGRAVVCFLFFFALPSCSLVQRMLYTEPIEGPRAKIRVVYGAATVRFWPGDACYNDKNKAAGIAGPVSGLVRKAKRLDMPLQPEKGKFEEFYVKAGEPMAVSFYYESETFVTPTEKRVETCGPVGYTFTPLQDTLYETRFEFLTENYCGNVLDQIIKDEAGNYKKSRLLPVPASSCRKGGEARDLGASGKGIQGIEEIERSYY